MRNVILYMMMSLDGFLTGVNGELDWMVPMEDEKALEGGLIDQVDTAFIGHGSYSEMSEYWQAAAKNTSAPKEEIEFANKINNLTKHIFSTTEEKLEWKNARQVLVQDDAALTQAVAKLKQESGKDIVLYGGVRLAQTFVRLGLIDEYRLVIHPLILGKGKRLFEGDNDKTNLKLVNTKQDKSGVMLLCYVPVQK